MRAAFKKWAHAKRIANKEEKDTLLHDINLLDKKEEDGDLSSMELAMRTILSQSLSEFMPKKSYTGNKALEFLGLKTVVGIHHFS